MSVVRSTGPVGPESVPPPVPARGSFDKIANMVKKARDSFEAVASNAKSGQYGFIPGAATSTYGPVPSEQDHYQSTKGAASLLNRRDTTDPPLASTNQPLAAQRPLARTITRNGSVQSPPSSPYQSMPTQRALPPVWKKVSYTHTKDQQNSTIVLGAARAKATQIDHVVRANNVLSGSTTTTRTLREGMGWAKLTKMI